jgi:DNA-binding transcriptional LysR family regulator
MRLTFDDPLFVKTPKGMVPTPKAITLSPAVETVLAHIDEEILHLKAFNPATLNRTFHIKTTDFIEALILPQLLTQLAKEAPGVKVSTTSPEFSLPREGLEQGHCDLAIGGFFGDLPDGFYQQKLFEDDFSCAVRVKHPRLGKSKTMDLDQFCEERHLLIAPSGELRGKVDLILGKRRARNIAAGCSSYVVSGWLVEGSDTVLTAPTQLIQLLRQKFELNILEAPFKIPDVSIVQVWHERNHRDPAHQWFRSLVKDFLQQN